jgi:hypothetical protein
VTLSPATAALGQEALGLHPGSAVAGEVLGGAGTATTAGPERWSCMLDGEPLDWQKGAWTEELTATAATVTECYLTVTDYSFSGIFRDGHLSVVFSKYRDLLMLPNQFSLYYSRIF